jgi:hypothetical protein
MYLEKRLLLANEQMFDLKENNHYEKYLATMIDWVYDDESPSMQELILFINIE